MERIDTHAAIVLLAGERAFKLKRAGPLQLPRLLHAGSPGGALRHELELNRRTAPMLYRRVLPVTREADGSLAVDGGGRPVEWLLEMRVFRTEAQLDHVAARGQLAAEA